MTNEVTTTTLNQDTPQDVTAIDPSTMYTARLEFRSIGDTLQVQPFFSYSHNFPDDYAGTYPASFLAMRDIAFELARISQTVYNTSIDDLPEDPDEYAAVAIATAQAQNEKAKH